MRCNHHSKDACAVKYCASQAFAHTPQASARAGLRRVRYSTVQAPAARAPGSRLSSAASMLDLLGAEVLEEQPADAGDVRAAGLAQLLVAGVGQLRVRHARVVRARDPLDRPHSTRPSTSRVIPDRVSIVDSASADIGSIRSGPARGTAAPRSRGWSSRARRSARHRARAGSRRGSAGSCATRRARYRRVAMELWSPCTTKCS